MYGTQLIQILKFSYRVLSLPLFNRGWGLKEKLENDYVSMKI